MAVRHSILGTGKIIGESKFDIGGYNLKVKFDSGLIRWCSKEELGL